MPDARPDDTQKRSAPPALPPARHRVGLWFGLLLLFVPVFYPLLYFRRYSWAARLGWGAWLGLIVFVKVSGLSEPVIDLTAIEQELRRQEEVGVAHTGTGSTREAPPAPTARGTFIQPEDAAPAPPLADYLRELGGGVLGRRIADTALQGREGAPDAAIRIAFEPVDWYLDGEDAVTLESIGIALSLFYGRDFGRVELHFVLQGRPLRVALERAAFEDFFAMDEPAIRASLADRAAQERSPFRAEALPPALRRAFFARFAVWE
jgi:hypothetical protein